MTTKTLRQAIDDVKILVDDDDLTDAVVTNWLMEALVDLAPSMRREAKTTINLLKDKADYTSVDGLPADIMTPFVARLDTEDDVIGEIAIGDFLSDGLKWWNETLTIQPTPSKARTLTLWYYRWPVVLTYLQTDTQLDIMEQFQHLPILYAAAKTQQRDEELEDKTDFMADYLTGKALAERFITQRQQRKRGGRIVARRPLY